MHLECTVHGWHIEKKHLPTQQRIWFSYQHQCVWLCCVPRRDGKLVRDHVLATY